MVSHIEEHVRNCAPPTQRMLQQLRRTIRAAAPGTTETVRYGIPTFQLNGKNLVHFAGYEHHIGFYPGPGAIEVFRSELKRFKTSKGTIQFPLDRPLPLALVRKVVRFRIDAMTPPNPFAPIAAPARRALRNAKIASLKSLTARTEQHVAGLHGMGPGAMRALKAMLRTTGLRFRPGTFTTTR